ncbi:MAG: hypothetical protein IPG17_25240 [Sandaracinaceae bacterium]|nr:hypothetical protein [Sandaracinaceae bacterium]
MTNPNDRNEAGPEREAYESPTILYREPLEAVAAVCSPGPPPAGPAKGSPAICTAGPISS